MKEYDLIVIGAGPAGLTAAIYASRMNLKTLILKGKKPSRLEMAGKVYNYPGFPNGIDGKDLLKLMYEQALKSGAEIVEDPALKVMKGEYITVQTKSGFYNCKAVIIAVGIARATKPIPGEEKFLGSGVSYCAVCDGPLYRKKRLILVGKSESTLEDAIFLSKITDDVTLVPNGKLSEELKRKFEELGLNVIEGRVKEIRGDRSVKSVLVKKENSEEIELSCDGVFIDTEMLPMSSLLGELGVETDERGCIIVNRKQETNVEGVYAAGDCTCGIEQVVSAAGEGATAAVNALIYIRRRKKK
ncbi:MAG: NAD(P)/FAD-dependent oxidoreductase [Candidatus Asgardarchaeia archaeon]